MGEGEAESDINLTSEFRSGGHTERNSIVYYVPILYRTYFSQSSVAQSNNDACLIS